MNSTSNLEWSGLKEEQLDWLICEPGQELCAMLDCRADECVKRLFALWPVLRVELATKPSIRPTLVCIKI